MAYGDTIRTASATLENVASLIEGTLVAYAEASGTGAFTTTSTSYVDYTSASVTVSTNTGELVLVVGRINFSVAQAANTVTSYAAIDADGSDTEVWRGTNCINNGAGDEDMPMFFKLYAPSSGSHTYKINVKIGSASYTAPQQHVSHRGNRLSEHLAHENLHGH